MAAGSGKPGAGVGSNASDSDIARWNEAEKKVKALEDLLAKLQKELNSADVGKVKKDVAMILQQFNIFVKQDDFAKLGEDIRKLKEGVQDNKYEVS